MSTSESCRELYLLRHGETAWSLSGQHTSHTDLPLTHNGEHEVRGLRERLRHLHFDHVFTSPLRRARQTCELSGLGARAQVEPALTEWDYGEYEGRRTEDIHAERPGWELFTDGCPGGETPAQVSARADRLLMRLRAQAGRVAVFSHGHFSRVLAVRWIGLPVAQARHFPLGTASLSVLGQEAHDGAPPVLLHWNTN